MNSSNLVSTQNVSANSALGSNSSSQSSSANSSNNSVKQFEKCTNLMVLVCYRKKNWLNKLLNHSLLTNLIRMLKVIIYFFKGSVKNILFCLRILTIYRYENKIFSKNDMKRNILKQLLNNYLSLKGSYKFERFNIGSR